MKKQWRRCSNANKCKVKRIDCHHRGLHYFDEDCKFPLCEETQKKVQCPVVTKLEEALDEL